MALLKVTKVKDVQRDGDSETRLSWNFGCSLYDSTSPTNQDGGQLDHDDMGRGDEEVDVLPGTWLQCSINLDESLDDSVEENAKKGIQTPFSLFRLSSVQIYFS
ncbi:hypothetical protein CMUS01_15007 [Colletotrichum musicola]|uniref:Uncharacterized protein n=1 Tax=Colletotrichum musicola TaxID=2175873 RepID=A0A8H6J0A0_9PEZI|nr:hypothetical protein CMUS01_15007 [Colletotrichum musicola]